MPFSIIFHSQVFATLAHFCKWYLNKGYCFMTEGLSLLSDFHYFSSFLSVALLLWCSVCIWSYSFKKNKLFFHWLWQSFCSRHGDLNSVLTEGCLLFLFSVFFSLPSPLIMGESCSKGAYLNLYNSRTHWLALLSKFSFILLPFPSLPPPTPILLSLLQFKNSAFAATFVALSQADGSFDLLLWNTVCMRVDIYMCVRETGTKIVWPLAVCAWLESWPQFEARLMQPLSLCRSCVFFILVLPAPLPPIPFDICSTDVQDYENSNRELSLSTESSLSASLK